MRFFAGILDVDGVLTTTARVHEAAWRRALEPFLKERGDADPFTRAEYLSHVDGKPRRDGLRDALAARGVTASAAEEERLAETKNGIFHDLLSVEGAPVYDDAARALARWRRCGLAIGFVSASRNAKAVLRGAGLLPLCDECVDGETAAREGLSGKRELFREAARRLDVEPGRAFAVEDAAAGVEAAKAVGLGLVVGVARGEGAAALLAERGADRVVARLDEIEGVEEADARPAGALPSALALGRVPARIDDRLPIVLLDFDGTLAPIVSHPDDAALSGDVRELVRDLAERFPVAIVSGRDRRDVARRVGVPGVWYAGSHGFEIEAPDGRHFTPQDAGPALAALREAEATLARELATEEGVVLERKAYALAVHYRTAPEAAAERAIRRAIEVADSREGLRLHWDLKVVELRPDLDWDKGRAARHILRALGGEDPRVVPVYVGDGPTDEDAFRELCGEGLGVLVGAPRRPTLADMGVSGQDDIGPLLRELLRSERAGAEHDLWTLRYEGWDPKQEALREALCTLGNGNFATRGAAEEAIADGVHYPGTYWAGGYDRLGTEIAGQVVVNEDFVNWPNWLKLSFRPREGEWLSLDRVEVLHYEQELDLRRGLLRRRITVRDRAGRETSLITRRLVSMDDPSIAALEWELTPINWAGRVEVRAGLDGSVKNDGVARYRQLRGDHLVPEGAGREGEDEIWLVAHARQSRIRMAQVARTRLIRGAKADSRRGDEAVDRIENRLEVDADPGHTVRLDKIVAIQTSRDPAISEPLEDARARARRAPGFPELAARHGMRWAELWRRCDIRLGAGREEENRILRLHVFHILQVISPHIIHRDTGVPARGLHGEAYRGHVFWDELFIFPVLNLQIPELTRELLMYRYLRLPAAREIARSLGCEGAAFPWQSGSSGREESQVLHLNPRSGRWVPDETLRQRHISAAVAWNVWQYVQTTRDHEFLSYYGAEMLVEIAQFWSSLAEWDASLGRYRIRQVVGPDEFHTRYPDSRRPGVDDNAYTNAMASWCLRAAEEALRGLSKSRRRELLEQLGVRESARLRWQDVARRLRIPFHDGHIISQFDGYDELEELDWDGYRERYGDIHRLDRILEAEGDTPNRYKASKQADVLMLLYLFSDDELVEQLKYMGYEFRNDWIRDNIHYYLVRTSHGSTLSNMLHSWVLARHDRAHSWRLFSRALRSDVDDIQGGTTPEGIHLGAMAGTVDLAQRCYTGAVVSEGVLWLDPQLPDEMPELCLRLRFCQSWIALEIRHDEICLEVLPGEPAPARVGLRGEIFDLDPGERRRLSLS